MWSKWFNSQSLSLQKIPLFSEISHPYLSPVNILNKTETVWSANFWAFLTQIFILTIVSTSMDNFHFVCLSRIFPDNHCFGSSGLNIRFHSENDKGTLSVYLLYNQTGLHNMKIDFSCGRRLKICYFWILLWWNEKEVVVWNLINILICSVKVAGRKLFQFDDY